MGHHDEELVEGLALGLLLGWGAGQRRAAIRLRVGLLQPGAPVAARSPDCDGGGPAR
jgi:hypothetical protein